MDADFALGDGELVREILDGHTELYRFLVRRHQDSLHGHAMRMVRHPDEAADLVQRAFVKGFERLSTCRDPDNVGGWLFRICANLCKDFLKSPRRSDISIEGESATVVDDRTPAESFEQTLLRERLDRAMEMLGPDQREAFVLKHLEGWSYEEMSDRLGVSRSALKMRVHRAREELQILLAVPGR